MSSRPPGLLLVLVAALVGLVLVPGSMSASDAGSASAPATAAGDPLGIALSHVRANTAELGVTSADVADLFVTSRYTSRHNGVTHVNLNQRLRGLEVFGGHATVNVAADGASSSSAAASSAGSPTRRATTTSSPPRQSRQPRTVSTSTLRPTCAC